MQMLRWNQRYLDEELVLLYRLQDQLYETNLIRESGEKIEFEGNEILRIKPYLYILTIMTLFLMTFFK